jgi:hypothetical protein
MPDSPFMDGTNHGTNPDPEESLRATYAGAKRRIATLEKQLQELQEAGPKRRL